MSIKDHLEEGVLVDFSKEQVKALEDFIINKLTGPIGILTLAEMRGLPIPHADVKKILNQLDDIPKWIRNLRKTGRLI